jgi:hypothetical protein
MKKKLPKLKGFKYNNECDFYGYQPLDGDTSCWYMEGRDESMLVGSSLPRTEEEAKLCCRCANIAHDHAMELAVQAFRDSMRQNGLDL